MFELNKYEKQVETNISICFILDAHERFGYSSSVDRTDSLCDTVRPIGLLSLSVQEKRRIFICASGGFFICFIGVYLLIGLVII